MDVTLDNEDIREIKKYFNEIGFECNIRIKNKKERV
jgi:predicted lactoylglutathione lyase